MTEQQVLNLYYIVIGSASVTACYRIRKADTATRFLCLFILYGFFNEILSIYSISLFRNNYILSNLYDYIAFILLGVFFYLNNESRKDRYFVLSMLLLGVAALPFNLLFLQDLYQGHQSLAEQISRFLILVISLYTIYKMVLRDEDATIYKVPLFWIATVFVFYQFINLWGRSAFYPFRLNMEKDKDYFFYIIVGINVLLYSLLTVFLWRYGKMNFTADGRR